MDKARPLQWRNVKLPSLAGLPRRYGVRFVAATILELLLLLLLIEAVFLLEKFAGILEDAILAKLEVSHLILVILSTAPEVLDLALPSALMIAVFRVVLRLRDNRELLAMAGIGVGAAPLMVVLLMLALPLQILSLVLSGYVEPEARFFQRAVFFQATYEKLSNGDARGQFQFPGGYTAFADPAKPGLEPKLFLHQPIDADTDRLVLAKRWQLVEGDEGWLTLRMLDFASFDFYSAPGLQDVAARQDPAHVALRTMQANEYQRAVETNQLIYFPPRGESSSEKTLPELWSENAVVDVARAVSRSLICLLAPLVALLAVSLTGAVSQVVTLPLGLAGLMSVDILATFLIKRFAGESLAVMISGLLAVALLALTLLVASAFRQQNGLLRPTMERA